MGMVLDNIPIKQNNMKQLMNEILADTAKLVQDSKELVEMTDVSQILTKLNGGAKSREIEGLSGRESVLAWSEAEKADWELSFGHDEKQDNELTF